MDPVTPSRTSRPSSGSAGGRRHRADDHALGEHAQAPQQEVAVRPGRHRRWTRARSSHHRSGPRSARSDPPSSSVMRASEATDGRQVTEHDTGLDRLHRVPADGPLRQLGASTVGSSAVSWPATGWPASGPGMMAPPTKAPSPSTTSMVVAVPMSTTITGAPNSSRAVQAPRSRSAPTRSGCGTATGMGMGSASASMRVQPESRRDVPDRLGPGRHHAHERDGRPRPRSCGSPMGRRIRGRVAGRRMSASAPRGRPRHRSRARP